MLARNFRESYNINTIHLVIFFISCLFISGILSCTSFLEIIFPWLLIFFLNEHFPSEEETEIPFVFDVRDSPVLRWTGMKFVYFCMLNGATTFWFASTEWWHSFKHEIYTMEYWTCDELITETSSLACTFSGHCIPKSPVTNE